VPFACAHRGLSSEKAENTLASFGAAVAAGFPAFEMDLRTTADGEVVVLHDAGIERTTDGTGRVDSMTWRELQDYPTPDGPVPRLADLFTSLAAWDGLWNLEVKDKSATVPTLDLVRQHGLAARALVTSMERKVLADARDHAPEVLRGAIPFGPVDDDDLAAAADAECAWVNVDHDFLDAGEMQRLRQAGLKVGSWTVNDVARAQELLGLGVECVITDRREVGAALRGPPPVSWA